MAVAWGQACKTNLDETLSVHTDGHIILKNLSRYVDSFNSANVTSAEAIAPDWVITLTNVGMGGTPSAVAAHIPPTVDDWTCWELILDNSADYAKSYFIIAWYGSGEEIDIYWKISLEDLGLYAKHGTQPPGGLGDRGVRKPEDKYYQQEWLILDTTVAKAYISCDYGFYDYDGNLYTEASSSNSDLDAGQPIYTAITLRGYLHDGWADTEYLELSANTTDYELSFDEFYQKFYYTYGYYHAEARGDGNKIHFKFLYDTTPTSGSDGVSATIFAPYLYNFTNFRVVKNVPYEEIDDAKLNIFGATTTVAALKAASPVILQYNSWNGWQANFDYDGTINTPAVAPRIDAAWAEANGYDTDDLYIHVDVGGLDWSTQGSPYRNVVDVYHDSSLDPMQPPGVSTPPEWWEGSPGVTVSGDEITVAAGAVSPKIAWEPACNFWERLDAYVDGVQYYGHDVNIPDAYHTLKANVHTWEPTEQIWNWDNFAFLKVDFDAPKGPLKINVHHYHLTINDNYCTGSTRHDGNEMLGVEPFSYERSAQVVSYTISEEQVEDGGPVYVDLRCPDGFAEAEYTGDMYAAGRVLPDLRWVYRVEIELPEDDSEQEYIIDITLTGRDGAAPLLHMHSTIPEKDGDDNFGPMFGISFLVDGKPCCRVPFEAPMFLRKEEGLPYYWAMRGSSQYTIGYDLGGARTPEQIAGLIAVQEGFDTNYNSNIANLMMYEDGDPTKKQLWSMMSCDLRDERLRGSDDLPQTRWACRVTEYNPVPLRVIDIYAEKQLWGGVWGLTVVNGKIAYSRTALHSWEQDNSYYGEGGDAGEWAYVGWSGPSETTAIIIPPMARGAYYTGVSVVKDVDKITNCGIIPEREFLWARAVGKYVWIGGTRHTIHALQPTARLLHFYVGEDGIYHIYSNDEVRYWIDSDTVAIGYANPHRDTNNELDDYPSAFYNMRGQLVLAWVRDAKVYYKCSNDLGETWSEETLLVSGYEAAYVWHSANSNLTYFVGVTEDGTIKYAYSTDGLQTLSDAVIVDTGAEVSQPSGVVTARGRICVTYRKDGDEVMSYSDNGGMTWNAP